MKIHKEVEVILIKEQKSKVNLFDCVLGNECKDEFCEIDRHNIIANICDNLGSCPSNFQLAEEIFTSLKYDIAKYVLHHEYGKNVSLNSDLLLWLDEKTSIGKKDEFLQFMKDIF